MITLEDLACLCGINSIGVIGLCIMFIILANYVDKLLTKERKAKERAEIVEDVVSRLRNGEHDGERK